MNYLGPEHPFSDFYYRAMQEVKSQQQTETEIQEFQTEVLLSYFQQINRGQMVAVERGKRISEEELVRELRQGILSGLLRVKWSKEIGGPHIAIVDDNQDSFVEAVVPLELFDLFAPDCYYYREMTNTIFEEFKEWVAGRLGALLGLEAGETLVTKMSFEEQMFVSGSVRELIRLIFEKQRELLTRLR